MKKINDLIKGLSKEELHLHKDLIDECLKREKDIIVAGEIINDNLNKMASIYQNIVTSLDEISKSMEKVEKVTGPSAEKNVVIMAPENAVVH